MNAISDNALQTYARLSLETGVEGATPERLIVMLYEGAIQTLTLARAEMSAGNAPGKGRYISKAIGIIEEGLRGALDEKAGGEIAGNLSSLYEYMSHQLMVANLRNDTAILDEVVQLLRDLKTAWETLIERQMQERIAAATASSGGRDSNSYGRV